MLDNLFGSAWPVGAAFDSDALRRYFDMEGEVLSARQRRPFLGRPYAICVLASCEAEEAKEAKEAKKIKPL